MEMCKLTFSAEHDGDFIEHVQSLWESGGKRNNLYLLDKRTRVYSAIEYTFTTLHKCLKESPRHRVAQDLVKGSQ